jgi:O-antigen ligase
LQAFRGELRGTSSLHPQEAAVITFAGILLCLMPWALGTMHVWSQFMSLGFAALAFGVALINRQYRGELAPQGDFKLIMWPKLIRFPIFWLGLLLLGYILIQALNPAWTYVQEGTRWWLEPLDHISWLPAGMETPYKDMNPWRVLVIYGSAWLLVCALWVGITRRAAIQTLLTVVVINGAVFSIVGILQKVTGAKFILWGLKEANTTGLFFSTIIYKNHAGAYLNLVLMICTALLYWHFSRAERRMERTSPAPIFAFFAILLGASVLLTASRGATILLIVFSIIAFGSFAVRCTLYRSESRSAWVIALLCTVFLFFIGLGFHFLNKEKAFFRTQLAFNNLLEKGMADSSLVTRNVAHKATWEMAKDNLVVGWGAGSFRHYFPVYQRNYPEIYKVEWNPKLRMRWEYAHNDYVQLIAELGLIGAGIFFAMLACGVRHLVRQQIYLRPHLLVILLALLVTAAHAWVDFQFHNPAILLLWCASAALVGRWAEMESKR